MDIDGTSNRNTAAYYGSKTDKLETALPITDYVEVQYAFRHSKTANQLFWDGHVKATRHFQETGVTNYKLLYDRTTIPNGGTIDLPKTGVWSEY